MSRNSNIELLRLICILSIILWHVVIVLNHFFPNTEFIWKEMILSITVPSVNIFILISGYFGLRFKYKKILYIIWITLFYSISIYVLVHQVNGHKCKLISIFMPISSNAYWFITTYIMLIFVSPIINSFIEIKKQIKALLVFTLINVFWGFVFKNPNSPSGYTLIHFINIYLIGRYLNLYFFESNKSDREINKIVNNVFFISVGIFTCIFFNSFFIRSYRYNNPIVIYFNLF